ncbi:MAG: InlB B-repeat-containing protein [Bacilli bacterium]|nr:InlB B-repeat-containing protein [Bacilli bacterium]
MKKKLLFIISSIIITLVVIISNMGNTYANDLDIDDILKTDSYSSLSSTVKQFLKDYYEENGVVLLTKDLAKDGDAYLNPGYIEYLDSENKEGYYVIPSVTAYRPVFDKNYSDVVARLKSYATKGETVPTSYDLRNVNGKNFVTPNKNQGSEGLCWAYSTASLIETHDLITKNKSYDSTATTISVKQIDYALSNNGVLGGNKIFNVSRTLSDGGALDYPEMLMLERLGGFSNTWDSENSVAINNGTQLAPNIIFNRNKSLFEIDGSAYLADINSDLSNTELNDQTILALKRLAYNYGGITVNIKTSDYNMIHNILNSNDYLTVTNVNYYSMPSTQHALHVIGWDDNYQYGFCSGDYGGTQGKFVSDSALYTSNHECGTYQSSGTTKNYVKVTGRGAFILKNSWGNNYPYVYLPYDSLIDGAYSIMSYSEKNWDDSHILKGRGIYDYTTRGWRYVYNVDSNLFNGDTAVKLKIKSNSPKTVNVSFSSDGSTNNLVSIGSYTFDYAGVITIDLQSRNFKITKESVFQIDDPSNKLILFTSKKDSTVKAVTDDVSYNINPSNITSVPLSIKTKLKNVSDNETITYKIKNPSGEYLPTTGYTVSLDKSYYGMVTPNITINSQYVAVGIYSLETWKGSSLLYTSLITLNDAGSVSTQEYVLTLDYNYNNLVDRSYRVTTVSPYGTLPTLTRDGYTFLGWYTAKTGGTKILATTIFTGTSDTTIYAHWQQNAATYYTVTFNSNGGSSVASQSVIKNGKATKPANPTKTGYTFKEWQLNNQTYDFNTPVTSNITLTAVWNINKYTVTFNSNGGSSVASQTVSYNGKATRPANPTKTGYTFKEWQVNNKTYDFNTPITGNITLTAIWTINKYTVTFNSNGGSSVASQTVSYNGKATRPANPTKTGYTFKEWQLNNKTYDFNCSVTSNITLVAIWQKNDGTVITLKEILIDNGYKVVDTYTSGYPVGVSISSLKSKIGNNITIEAKTDIISTGSVIKRNNESYTVYLIGDLNGDGKINSADLLLMRKYLLEDGILTGAYKKAGIIESSNDIKSLDLLRLRQYLLGEYTFK